MEAPDKIYVNYRGFGVFDEPVTIKMQASQIEYTRTDSFIEKTRKWFEKRYEWIDIDGTRNYDKSAFEDFKNYMKGE